MKEPILYRMVRPIITWLFRLIYHPTYIGLNNISTDTKCVLAGNHTNNFDCLLLISSTKRTIHFLAKDELTKGLKKIIFNNMAIIPVNRKIHDKNALNSGINVLNNGGLIGIFPEGTINKTNDTIMPFKIGAIKMAHDTESKIVPFVITGKYKPFRKSITVEFFKPFAIENNLDVENKKLMHKIKTELEKKE